MEKENICNSIRYRLEDIREQFEIIRGYEGKIPSIELDLILSNLREVYEDMRHLEHLNLPQEPIVVIERKDTPAEVPAEPEPIVIRIKKPEPPQPPPAEEPETPPSDTRKEEDVPEAENETEVHPVETMDEKPADSPVEILPPVMPVINPVKPLETASDHRRETPAPEQKPVKTTLDLFGESTATTTLADKLKDGNEKRMADRLKDNKIADLRAAIGINEKFLYINELFDGSLRDYEDAVARLNGCTDPDEASMIIFEFRERYQWDLDNPAVRSFIELVNRKF